MQVRAIFRWAFSTISGIVVTPFLQAPATKLAEALHFDTTFTERWGPLMQWLSNLAENPWYIFAAGMTVGLALGLWLDTILRKKDQGSGANRGDRIDFTRSTYTDMTFDLQDLLRSMHGPKMGLLSKKTFNKCTFLGPAVMLFDGLTELGGNLVWDNVGSALKVFPGELVNGAVPFLHCSFNDCTFKDVQPLLMDGQPYQVFVTMANHVLPPRKLS